MLFRSNAPMLAAQRDARALVALITTTAEKYEAPIDAAIKARDAEREVERLAAVAVEEARIAVIRARIAVITNLPSTVAGMTSEQIGEVMDDVNEMPINAERFAEFVDEAQELVQKTVVRLNEMRNAEAGREAAAEALQQERDALVAQQKREAEEREADAKVAALHARISAISSVPLAALGKSAVEIGEIIKGLVPPSADEFGNLISLAMTAYTTSGLQLQGIFQGQRATEQSEAIARNRATDEANIIARETQVTPTAPVTHANQTDAFQVELVDESAASIVRVLAAKVERAAYVAEERALTPVADVVVVEVAPVPEEPVVSQLVVPMDLAVPEMLARIEVMVDAIDARASFGISPAWSWKKITSTQVLLSLAESFGLNTDDALNVLRALNFVELEDYCAGIEVPF